MKWYDISSNSFSTIIRRHRKGTKNMFCYNCGAKIMDYSKFCPLCGSKQIPLEEMNGMQEELENVGTNSNLGGSNLTNDRNEKAFDNKENADSNADGNNESKEYDNEEEKGNDWSEADENNGDGNDDSNTLTEEAVHAAIEKIYQEVLEKGAFHIGAFTIYYTEEERMWIKYKRPFQMLMVNAVKQFEIYRQENIHGLDDVVKKTLPYLSKYLDNLIALGVETLIEHSIDYIDQATLKNMLFERCPIDSVFGELIEADRQVEQYASQLNIESESRIQFVGGGFGIGGAIIGTIEAGILNLGADVLSGVGNWLIGNSPRAKMKRFQDELYNKLSKNWETNVITLWGDIVFSNVWAILMQCDVLEVGYFGPFNPPKASAKLNNVRLMIKNNKYSMEQAVNSLLEGLKYNPYNEGYYRPLLYSIVNARADLIKFTDMCGTLEVFLPILATYDDFQKKELIKKYTQDQSIIDQSEYAATNQDELSEMLDDEDDVIYLIENEYSLPAKTRNVRFIGLGHVVMHINSNTVVDFDALGITFENIEFDKKYSSLLQGIELVQKGINCLVEEKYEEAMFEFTNARKLGNKDASNLLGWMFENGLGRDVDEEQARKFYDEATDSMTSAFWIGLRYKTGFNSVAANYDKAEQWLRRDPSDAMMLMGLADLYEKGVDGRTDKKAALEIYQKVSQMNKPPLSYYALYKCAMLSDTDIAQKAAWLEEASKHEILDATYQLGLLHLEKYEEIFKETKSIGENKAFEYFKKASAKGIPDALYQLGIAYLDGRGVEQSDRLAVDYFRKAADKGHIEATVELGVCYANGTGIKQNYERAIELYRVAADKGNNEAQLNLGICYQYGAGVEKNMEEAVHWYKLAMDNGNKEAADMLNKAKESMLQSYNL